MSQSTMAALGCAILMAVWAPADASSTLRAPTLGISGQQAILAQSNGVTGFNLLVAEYPGGKFEKWEGNSWREYTRSGIFNFVEQARGETTVMLFDPSRNVYIELDVVNREVRYGEAGQQFQLLYQITNMTVEDSGGGGGQVGGAANARVIEYTCDEGLQMTVQFEENGNQSFATYSIDTSPFQRLTRIPSGSGAVYSNGRDTLSTKGLSAVLETPSGQTRCSQN